MSAHGFSTATAQLLRQRAGGICERCRAARDVHSHHRRPRGAGGDRSQTTNSAANGLRLCLACHDWVESHRCKAIELGLLVSRYADPETTPVYLFTPFGEGWWLLSPDGSYAWADAPAQDSA